MKYAIIVEKFDSESGGTVGLDSHSFCSEDCTNEFLFGSFEIEGLDLSKEQVIDLSNCKITVSSTEDESQCEYGC